jgi:hypothetical protein
MLCDSNGFKPHIYFLFFKNCPCATHIYIYSIGPTPKSVEYHLFGQFLKFLLDMSGLWTGHIRLAGHVRPWERTCPGLRFPAYIRGLSAPLRTLGLFFSSTPSLAAAKGSLDDFGSSPSNPFSFLEI